MLFAGTTLINCIKYSILNDTVTKLKQRSISAGNILNVIFKIGTSETLRNETGINSVAPDFKEKGGNVPLTACENVKSITVHVPKHLKPITDDQFGHYLAGLIDGDGHFSSKQQLVIVFHSLDASLAYYIKTRIGYGSVKRTKQAVLLIITKCEGLEKIFNLINGKLRTQSKYNVINNYILNVLYFNLLQRKIDFKLNNSNCLNNH